MSKLKTVAESHSRTQVWFAYGAVLVVLLLVFVGYIIHLRRQDDERTLRVVDSEFPSRTGDPSRPVMDMQLKRQTADGLIVLSGPPASNTPDDGKTPGKDAPAKPIDVPEWMKDLSVADLKAIEDGKPVTEKEKRAYYYLAWQAFGLKDGPGELRGQRVTRTKLFDTPAEHRGKLLHVRGDLVSVDVVTLDPNPTGRLRIYQVGLLTGEGGPVFILVWNDPVEQGLRLWDTVSVDGLFFKIWCYSLDDEKSAPLVMGYSLELIPVPPRRYHLVIAGLLVLLVCVAFVLVLVGCIRARTTPPSDWQRMVDDDSRRELEDLDRQLNP